MFALLGTFMASLFTYPSGVIGTFVSGCAVYFGWLTPAESVLAATPLYIGAGYFQWYVLIPRYFRPDAFPKIPRTREPARRVDPT